MTVLSDGDRVGVLRRFATELSSARQEFAVSKPDLRAAVNAIDDWANANQASFNNAIPLPARTSLTTKQKVQLLFYVLMRRYEVEP
jgi:hypothetical protein